MQFMVVFSNSWFGFAREFGSDKKAFWYYANSLRFQKLLLSQVRCEVLCFQPPTWIPITIYFTYTIALSDCGLLSRAFYSYCLHNLCSIITSHQKSTDTSSPSTSAPLECPVLLSDARPCLDLDTDIGATGQSARFRQTLIPWRFICI